jgi:DNA ligase-1
MKYTLIADAYGTIEATTKRLEMTSRLVDLINTIPKERLREVVYLTQGKLYPDFMGVEIGMADKLVIHAIARVVGVQRKRIVEEWKRIGDLGTTVETLLEEPGTARQLSLEGDNLEPLTVEEVYGTLNEIARTSGKGSVEAKINLLADLLRDSTPKEAKYLVRTVTGRLRLGIGDMTLLDALAIAFAGGKAHRKIVETAYNISSDLGLVAETLATRGLSGVRTFSVQIGHPIRPMLCERLTTSEEILTKLQGKGAAEYKYDGLRIQSHLSPEKTYLFSRRMENITRQFPDVIEALQMSVKACEAILEGECVAVDPHTGEVQPFQVVTQRRGRKHDIKRMIDDVPVALILFDILYLDGASLLDRSYVHRRERLEDVVHQTDRVKLTQPLITGDPEELDRFMETAIADGVEGLVVKSLSDDSMYQAGSRGYHWIKYKRDYRSEMADTVDLVVVGAFAGRGRRAGTYGALLMAAYDAATDTFQTVCRLGTGFDDETLGRLPTLLEEYTTPQIHPRVDSQIEADYWFIPVKVLEVVGSELTRSPSHTSGWSAIQEGAGLAIRFPRFTGRWRADKSAEDATTVEELIDMYKSQLKTVK